MQVIKIQNKTHSPISKITFLTHCLSPFQQYSLCCQFYYDRPNINLQIIINLITNMAYIARQESMKQWASLVTQQQVTSLKHIQNIDFVVLLLSKLDADYFIPKFSDKDGQVSFTSVFTQIANYYSKVIKTNVRHIVGDEINIYSSAALQDIWELVIGIAIKGRFRQDNINQILNMDHRAQQDLMKVISKVIAKFGQNVSVVESRSSMDGQNSYNQYSNDADIIIELSEENNLLKQKIDDLAKQIRNLKDKKDYAEKQLEERKNQHQEILAIMAAESVQFGSSIQGSSSLTAIAQYIRDLHSQLRNSNKQLSRKQQKVIMLQEMNKQIKIAYSTAMGEMDSIKNITQVTQNDIKNHEAEIEALRQQNLQFAKKQEELLQKIQALEEQKYYLKEIAQRFQNKVNISEEKIDQLIRLKQNSINDAKNNIHHSEFEDDVPPTSYKLKLSSSDSKSSQIQGQKKKTVRYEIDEINEPSLRNKLQRQVSHLQKKVNSLQNQNSTLKKINTVLEKVIHDYTVESAEAIKQCEEQFEPMMKEMAGLLSEREEISDENRKLKDQEKDFRILLEKIKSKIQEFDSRELEYQKVIKKLQLERNQLINTIKEIKDFPENMPSWKTQKLQQPKVSIIPPKTLEIPRQTASSEQQGEITLNEPKIVINQLPPPKPKQQIQKIKYQSNSNNFLNPLSAQPTSKHINMDSCIGDDEQQITNRRRQYSYMGNRMSSYKMPSEIQLGIKENPKNFKSSEMGSGIWEEDPRYRNNSQIGGISEKDQEQSDGHVDLFDITELEEGLMQIKEQYGRLNSKTLQLYQNFSKKETADEDDSSEISSNSLEQSKSAIFKEYQQLLQKKPEKLKSTYMRDIGVFSPELVRLHHENKALRHQLSYLLKQKNRIAARLKEKEQLQPSEPNKQQNKEEVHRLTAVIRQANQLLQFSQGSYMELQEYFSQAMEGSSEKDKKIAAIQTQLERAIRASSHYKQTIKQLEMELGVLAGAFLQLKNYSQKY